MDNKAKKIGKSEIYKGIRVHVIKENIVLPNGKEVEWELVKHPGAAAVIPVDKNGKILLVKQYRNAADDYTLEIPAGGLDSLDEEPMNCASRELEEETGYKAEKIEYLYSFYSAIGLCDEVIHIYVATDLIKTQQNLDEDEFVTIEKYSLDELVDMIMQGEIKDNKTISSILFYKEKYFNNKK